MIPQRSTVQQANSCLKHSDQITQTSKHLYNTIAGIQSKTQVNHISKQKCIDYIDNNSAEVNVAPALGKVTAA